MADDIIDRINELVDTQLQQHRSGYDHNVNQPRCWHCGRDFHGLPITERMEALRRLYPWAPERVDRQLAEYDYRTDASMVLCPGSNSIGPARPNRSSVGAGHQEIVATFAFDRTQAAMYEAILGFPMPQFGDVDDHGPAEAAIADGPPLRYVEHFQLQPGERVGWVDRDGVTHVDVVRRHHRPDPERRPDYWELTIGDVSDG